MIITVTGGVSSGKSSIAEDIACKLGGRKAYIAAMEPFGDEALIRIEKHKAARAGKGFETVERRCDIIGLALKDYDTALFECVSNLLANEMFSGCEFDISNIISGFEKLAASVENLVMVTNDVSGTVIEKYPDSVREYIKNMGTINVRLAAMSDVVVESVAGIPVFLKGRIEL